MKSNIGVIFLFFFLALLQVSFLPHFPIAGTVLNLVVLALFLLALLEPVSSPLSFLGALAGGVTLDLFSETFFGFWVFLLLALVFLVKHVLLNYVRIPFFKPLS